MTGITDEVLDHAQAWLVEHGHSMEGIGHPEGAEGRQMASLALYLNVFMASEEKTVELIVDCLAFRFSGGQVCRHVLDAA